MTLPSANHREQPVEFFKGTGVLCMLCGLLMSLAWGFRLYILVMTAPGDRWVVLHSAVTIISLAAAVMLVVIGVRTIRQQNLPRDTWWVTGIGCWIIGVGLNRLVAVLLWPAADPNPRAHLHLAVSFMVMGLVLWLLGGGALWRGRRSA
jgi:hypothetical protein